MAVFSGFSSAQIIYLPSEYNYVGNSVMLFVKNGANIGVSGTLIDTENGSSRSVTVPAGKVLCATSKVRINSQKAQVWWDFRIGEWTTLPTTTNN